MAGFVVIPSATGLDYSPGALTESTYFRRVAISTENGASCESAPTTPILINVIGELFAHAGDDQLQYNSPVFTLGADIPTLGDGKWTIVSGTLDEELTDDTNSQAIIKLLPNSTVTLRWTVSEMGCSVYDDITLTHVAEADLVTVKSLKDPAQTTFVPGEEVVYTITVTNDGPSDAQDVNIQDTAPLGTTISSWAASVISGTVVLPNTSGTGNLNETLTTLPNGAVISYAVTVKTPADFVGNLVNTVSVTSSTDDPDPLCSACETVPIVPKISSQLELWKTSSYHDLNGDGKVSIGDVINYHFIVRNTGNGQIDDIRIQDPIVTVNGGPISLAAGATDQTAFSAVYTITQADIDKGRVYNLATASGKDLFGNEVTINSKDPVPLDPNDPATITVLEAQSQVILVKTVMNEGTGNDGAFLLGDEIQYHFVVTNTGNTTLSDIILNDPLISSSSIVLPGNILPNVSITHIASYKVARTDADKGNVLNQATVTAKDPKGILVKAISGTALGNNDPTQTPISNMPPSANDDESEAESGKTVVIRVDDNDQAGSFDIDPSSIEIIDRPLNGTFIINSDGTVSYTPNAGYVGTDTFTYRIKDANGNWSNTAVVTINVGANDLFIPNAFTPNGDGKNDKFEIIGLEGYGSAELSIFNRWGNEVYRSKDYQNNWDGSNLNEGTYYYMITLKKEGKESAHKGWVLLKR